MSKKYHDDSDFSNVELRRRSLRKADEEKPTANKRRKEDIEITVNDSVNVYTNCKRLDVR